MLFRNRVFQATLRHLMAIVIGPRPALLGVLVVLGGTAYAWPTPPPAAVRTLAPPLVFDGVTVVDVEHGRLLPHQRVVIVGNRIRSVGSGSTVQIPAGARVVDARGKYLIPGLWDMHTHPDDDTARSYPLLIANGITGIRNAGSPVPLATMRQWQREILAGMRVGPPRQLLAGPALDDKEFAARFHAAQDFDICHEERHLCVTDSADARRVVDSLKAAGADFIKMYALTAPMYFVIAAEARRIGIPFGGHLDMAGASPFIVQRGHFAPVSPVTASDSGVSIIDHPNTSGGLDKLCVRRTATVERCQPVAEQFRRHGSWWVPTLLTFFASNEQYKSMGVAADKIDPTQPASWALLARFYQVDSLLWRRAAIPSGWLRGTVSARPPLSSASQGLPAAQRSAPVDSVGLFHIVRRVGLPLLAGTDMTPAARWASPGLMLHTELALYAAEGLTPLEALQTATLNPAKYLHGTDSLGTVAPGKLADLVLLDANPLQDITNTTAIRAVVANGRYYDRATLDRLVADAEAKYPQH